MEKLFYKIMYFSEKDLKNYKKDITEKQIPNWLFVLSSVCIDFRERYPIISKIPFLNWYIFKKYLKS